jgi:glucose/arabinose dehydrogenase
LRLESLQRRTSSGKIDHQLIGVQCAGQVYAVAEGNQGRAGEVIVVASGLREPNGVAFKDGDLSLADIDRVLKYTGIEDRLHQPPKGILVSDDLPMDDHHGWRYATFGPDDLLYIAVGAPCNVCEGPDPYATIIRMDEKGEYEVFARGIRNSVGFDGNPRQM